jgi:hypothetical protein
MYFSTFHFYEEDIEFDIDNSHDEYSCLFCLEPASINSAIYNLDSVLIMKHLTKTCECNGLVHYDCLVKWNNTTHSCPICRSKISKIHDNRDFTINLKNKIFRCIIFLIALKTIFEIVNNILNVIDYNITLAQRGTELQCIE